MSEEDTCVNPPFDMDKINKAVDAMTPAQRAAAVAEAEQVAFEVLTADDSTDGPRNWIWRTIQDGIEKGALG